MYGVFWPASVTADAAATNFAFSKKTGEKAAGSVLVGLKVESLFFTGETFFSFYVYLSFNTPKNHNFRFFFFQLMETA